MVIAERSDRHSRPHSQGLGVSSPLWSKGGTSWGWTKRRQFEQTFLQRGYEQRCRSSGGDTEALAGAFFITDGDMGRLRKRTPVAAKTALPTAGASGGIPGSPMPPRVWSLLLTLRSIILLPLVRNAIDKSNRPGEPPLLPISTSHAS